MATNPLKLNVMICHPSYGGNGGISSEHPDIREWEIKLIPKMRQDPRVGEIRVLPAIADTPITMVRNRFVIEARKANAHVLLMVDSDQSPEMYAGRSWYKPFWDEAFGAIYEHYHKGPLMIGAPYTGLPGSESVYVFRYVNFGVHGAEGSIGRYEDTVTRLEAIPRNEAAMLRGVQEVDALPTGMILTDMRLFDLIEPSKLTKSEILDRFLEGKIKKSEALAALEDGWFYYEWRDQYATHKASTEDVVATRNLALACVAKHGYNPLRCAWSSWIGHHKPCCVGRPEPVDIKHIAGNLRNAIERQSGEQVKVDAAALLSSGLEMEAFKPVSAAEHPATPE